MSSNLTFITHSNLWKFCRELSGDCRVGKDAVTELGWRLEVLAEKVIPLATEYQLERTDKKTISAVQMMDAFDNLTEGRVDIVGGVDEVFKRYLEAKKELEAAEKELLGLVE